MNKLAIACALGLVAVSTPSLFTEAAGAHSHQLQQQQQQPRHQQPTKSRFQKKPTKYTAKPIESLEEYSHADTVIAEINIRNQIEASRFAQNHAPIFSGIFDEDEEQWDAGVNVGTGGWNASVGNSGFTGTVSGGFNGGSPTLGGSYAGDGWSAGVTGGNGSYGLNGSIGGFTGTISQTPGGVAGGVGYSTPFLGGSLTTGVSTGPGGWAGGINMSLPFEEEAAILLEEIQDEMQEIACMCVRAPCPC